MHLIDANGKYSDGCCWICNRVNKKNKRRCRIERNVRVNSIFEGSKLNLPELVFILCFITHYFKIDLKLKSTLFFQLFIFYSWFKASSQSQTTSELDFSTNRSVCRWAKVFRKVCMYHVYANCNPIGGESCTVEIDESKFGKSELVRSANWNVYLTNIFSPFQ